MIYFPSYISVDCFFVRKAQISMWYPNVSVWRRFLVVLSVLLKLLHLFFCLELFKTFCCFTEGCKDIIRSNNYLRIKTSFLNIKSRNTNTINIHKYRPFLYTASAPFPIFSML